MPDASLDGLSVEERASIWRQWLEHAPRPRGSRLVAEATDGAVIGFALVGPADGDPDADRGELYAINVDPDHWGTGAGAELLERAVAALRSASFEHAVLWVHPGNRRARSFYEAGNWVCDEVERREEVLGVAVPEVRYSIVLSAPSPQSD